MAEKGYRFLCKNENDSQYYVSPVLVIDRKIIDAFVKLDQKNRCPDEIKYVDGATIFPSVVCNYLDVDPNTNYVMGKRLLKLVKKRVISNLKIVSTYDPNTTHPMNELQPDGRYRTKWDIRLLLGMVIVQRKGYLITIFHNKYYPTKPTQSHHLLVIYRHQ